MGAILINCLDCNGLVAARSGFRAIYGDGLIRCGHWFRATSNMV